MSLELEEVSGLAGTLMSDGCSMKWNEGVGVRLGWDLRGRLGVERLVVGGWRGNVMSSR